MINFDIVNQGSDCFGESETIADIQKHRDLILWAIMKRTRQVLALMRAGRRKQVQKLLHKLGHHDKRRSNEYLGLMYLMLLAGSPSEEIEADMKQLRPSFVQEIQSINRTSRETARESNPTATALSTLFNEWRTAVKDDQNFDPGSRMDTHAQKFVQRFQIALNDDGELEKVLSRDLFVALKRIAREYTLRFDLDSSRQFAQRFANDLETLREAGFRIRITEKQTWHETLHDPKRLKDAFRPHRLLSGPWGPAVGPFLRLPGLLVHDRANLPDDVGLRPVNRFVPVLDGLSQMSGEGGVVRVNGSDGSMDGVAEGVPEILALVFGFAKFATQSGRFVDGAGDPGYFFLETSLFDRLAGIPDILNLSEYLLGSFPVLLDGFPVGNESCIPERNPLRNLQPVLSVTVRSAEKRNCMRRSRRCKQSRRPIPLRWVDPEER